MKSNDSNIADVHNNAYNAAFHELGLSWHWDDEVYARAACAQDERAGLRTYLAEHQAHLLTAYDAEFLVNAIQAAKERCLAQLTAAGCNPGAYINWRALRQPQSGV